MNIKFKIEPAKKKLIRMTIAENLKRILKERNISHEKIGEIIGVKRAAMTMMLNGKTGIEPDRLTAIADFLQIDETSLKKNLFLGDANIARIAEGNLIKVPRIELKNIHTWRDVMRDFEAGDNKETTSISATRKFEGKAFSTRLTNNLLAPKLEVDDEILIDTGKVPKEGNYVALSIAGQTGNFVKRYTREGDYVYLSINDQTPSEKYHHESINIIGVVVSVIKELA